MVAGTNTDIMKVAPENCSWKAFSAYERKQEVDARVRQLEGRTTLESTTSAPPERRGNQGKKPDQVRAGEPFVVKGTSPNIVHSLIVIPDCHTSVFQRGKNAEHSAEERKTIAIPITSM